MHNQTVSPEKVEPITATVIPTKDTDLLKKPKAYSPNVYNPEKKQHFVPPSVATVVGSPVQNKICPAAKSSIAQRYIGSLNRKD